MTQNEIAHEREHSRLALVQAALGALDDLDAGRVLPDEELDRLVQANSWWRERPFRSGSDQT